MRWAFVVEFALSIFAAASGQIVGSAEQANFEPVDVTLFVDNFSAFIGSPFMRRKRLRLFADEKRISAVKAMGKPELPTRNKFFLSKTLPAGLPEHTQTIHKNCGLKLSRLSRNSRS